MFEKAVEEKETAEAEKRKARQEREETTRALIDEFRLQDAAVREKRKQEEKILKDWEMMQRFKRDECNKQADLDEREQQWQQKLKYGDELRKLAVRIIFCLYTRARVSSTTEKLDFVLNTHILPSHRRRKNKWRRSARKTFSWLRQRMRKPRLKD